MDEFLRKVAHKTSEAVGSSWAFGLAVLVIVVRAVTGPLFGFSDTWQLVIIASCAACQWSWCCCVNRRQSLLGARASAPAPGVARAAIAWWRR